MYEIDSGWMLAYCLLILLFLLGTTDSTRQAIVWAGSLTIGLETSMKSGSGYNRHEFEDYSDAIMRATASQITSVSIVCSPLLFRRGSKKISKPAFVREIHRWPVNSPQKGSVTRKMFLFDDVIMNVMWKNGGHFSRSQYVGVKIDHSGGFTVH